MASIDFSALAPEDLTVVLPDGSEHQVPADIPIPIVARLVHGAEQLDQGDGEEFFDRAGALYDELLALFRVRQPDLASIEVGHQMLRPVIFGLLNPDAIGERQADPQRAEEAPSTKKTTSGRKSSLVKKAPKASASRSSTSSAS